jgi:SHQ1 protein
MHVCCCTSLRVHVTCCVLLHYDQVWSTDVQAVVVADARRSLCYPYLRSWSLTHKCLCDVAAILQASRRVVLKCLLSLHATVGGSEYHYLLNKVRYIYICINISIPRQGVKASTFLCLRDLCTVKLSCTAYFRCDGVRCTAACILYSYTDGSVVVLCVHAMYCYSQLYVTDYCVWLQRQCTDDSLSKYALQYSAAVKALTKGTLTRCTLIYIYTHTQSYHCVNG